MSAEKEKHLIRPYGDRKDDGVIQLSFVLPVPVSEQAKEAAAAVAKKLGLSHVLVSAMERAGEGYSFFVVYGRTHMQLDYNAIEVPVVLHRKHPYDELNDVTAKLTPTIAKRLDAKGFVLLNWGHGGWTQIFTKRPVKTLDDLKSIKLYTSAGNDRMVAIPDQYHVAVVHLYECLPRSVGTIQIL